MRVKIPKPIARFRVYPGGKALYYLVTVFRSLKEMHAYCRRGPCRWDYPGSKFQAVVHTGERTDHRGRRARKNATLGEMHFTKNSLTMNIITHESVHAALGWFRRKHRLQGTVSEAITNKDYGVTGVLDMLEYEEELCYAAGHIGKEIVSRCEQFKLL